MQSSGGKMGSVEDVIGQKFQNLYVLSHAAFRLWIAETSTTHSLTLIYKYMSLKYRQS